MKAVVFREFGSSDVLRLEELDDPRPGPGEVAAGRRGLRPQPPRRRRARGRLALPDRAAARPRRRGGRTDRRGRRGRRGLGGRRPGDAVPDGHVRLVPLLHDGPRVPVPVDPASSASSTPAATPSGSCCSASQLIRVPDEIGDAEAAALQIAFATAWHMLFTRGNLRLGRDGARQLGRERHRLGRGAARAHGGRVRDRELVAGRQARPRLGARDGRRHQLHGAGHRRGGHASHGRPRRRPRLRARRRRALPGGSRLALEGRAAGHLRRPLGARSSPSTSSPSSARRSPSSARSSTRGPRSRPASSSPAAAGSSRSSTRPCRSSRRRTRWI